ncbi:MAG: oxygen-independent coproporphyrinogen-3 oxidase [Oceanicoccus sp.]|jgi:oxygen-independent coproporphyrinogen-3 oxidase
MSVSALPQLTELPPLSLYIHIPWCVRKCPYCDFNSHTSDNIPEQEYVDALLADLDNELAFVNSRPLTSIFFGGGTPSLFNGGSIARILRGVEQRITFSPDIEITLEANPGTVEQDKFSAYFQSGVNRLSIGVQSFSQQQLTALGRIHNSDESIKAAHTAKKAGFTNFNIDLMHGLPNQNVAAATADLEQALALGATHLSWYQLTIEPNTAFYSAPPLLPEENLLADIQQAGELILKQNGLIQYEVSAYSLTGKAARHNLNYWQFGDYLGIGAGAHGKVSSLTEQSISRRWKTRAPKDYLDRDKKFLAGNKTITAQELPLDFFMNALRLNEGVAQSLFQRRTGLALDAVAPLLAELVDQQLLTKTGANIHTTELGRRFLNSVLEKF